MSTKLWQGLPDTTPHKVMFQRRATRQRHRTVESGYVQVSIRRLPLRLPEKFYSFFRSSLSGKTQRSERSLLSDIRPGVVSKREVGKPETACYSDTRNKTIQSLIHALAREAFLHFQPAHANTPV